MPSFSRLLLLAILAASLALPAGVAAQIQLCSAEKLAKLKASLPKTDDPKWDALFRDPRTMFYTAEEIPPAYQHASGGLISGGRFVPLTNGSMQSTFHSPAYNISGNASENAKGNGFGGNGNIEFPWRTPGGTDFDEQTAGTFKFMRLPDRDSGGVWPVAWYTQVMRDARVGPNQVWAWTFPVGAIFGEVLYLRDSKGFTHTYEVRLRIREIGFWEVEILRPFPTAADLAARLEQMNPAGYVEDVKLLRTMNVTPRRLDDPLHRRSAFDVLGGENLTPASLTEVISAELLGTTPFKSAVGQSWKHQTDELISFAPTGRTPFGIVPRNYEGTFLGTDNVSCKRCHEHVLKHVDNFDAQRDWYGRIRGSDQIFTFHPIAPNSIARNGGGVAVRFRQAFIDAGMLEQFDPAKHPNPRYSALK